MNSMSPPASLIAGGSGGRACPQVCASATSGGLTTSCLPWVVSSTTSAAASWDTSRPASVPLSFVPARGSSREAS